MPRCAALAAEVIQGIAPKELQEALVGKTVVAVKRLGKHMWLELQDSPALLLHFGERFSRVLPAAAASAASLQALVAIPAAPCKERRLPCPASWS